MSHVDDGMLHAYLDGELSPPEVQGVEAHVAQCPACRERLEEERALIARASELLARAAPPERDAPPFRPGDVKPPARLWWQVRLPLAWAATIALALGIGTYVGDRGALRSGREASPEGPAAVAGRLAPTAVAPARDSVAVVERQSFADSRARAAKRSAAPAKPVAAAEEERKQEELAQARADTIGIRGSNALSFATESAPMVVDGHRMAAKAVAPPPAPAPHPEIVRPEMVWLATGRSAVKGAPIEVDSARLLLGRDPLVVPDLPILGIYRARMIGYSGMVIIDQALDSTTTIEVINARPVSLRLDAIVVSEAGGARADSVSAGARALLNKPVADSLAAASRPAPAPAPAAPTPAPAPAAKRMKRAEQAGSDLFVDVRGPLPADSLAALRRLLRPLRP